MEQVPWSRLVEGEQIQRLREQVRELQDVVRSQQEVLLALAQRAKLRADEIPDEMSVLDEGNDEYF